MSLVRTPHSFSRALPSVDPLLGESFAGFVYDVDQRVRAGVSDDVELCEQLQGPLAHLVADPAWIPAELVVPAQVGYRRECLYQAPDAAFSIGVFTWKPGHKSRIHDHHAWAVLGNMTGTLRAEQFLAVNPGRVFKRCEDTLLGAGEVVWSTPDTGDIHRISVASEEISISIHIYGCSFSQVNREYYIDIAEEATPILRDSLVSS